jgi:trehalose 6-phosphate synthase/phosphatase
MVERKSASVSWHYREAEPEYGLWRARELLVAVDNVLGGIPAEVLPGRRVIEVRARGVNKGSYLRRLLAAGRRDDAVYLAAGDDVTDTDLFRVLPAGSVAIHVGGLRRLRRRTPLEHEYLVDSPATLRAALAELARELGAGSRTEEPGGAGAVRPPLPGAAGTAGAVRRSGAG